MDIFCNYTLEILGGWGSQKPKFLKESIKLNLNFLRDAVQTKNLSVEWGLLILIKLLRE